MSFDLIWRSATLEEGKEEGEKSFVQVTGEPSISDEPSTSDGGSSSHHTIDALVDEDHEHDIKLRTMSWQKAAWLLAGDQMCLAIMAQTHSLSILGWIPGLLTILVFAVLFYITSLTMHKFIMKHPQIRDICDFGYYACGKSNAAYWFTAFMLLANNVILVGFHVLTGAKVLNTLSDHSTCTVLFAAIITILGILLSLPRELKVVSLMSIASAAAMAISILLFLIFAAIEPAPGGHHGSSSPDLGPVTTRLFPAPATSWITLTGAILNIAFLWVPQILFPTFISEMQRPQDFPKALAVLAALSALLFVVPPALGYVYLGQYSTAPAFAALGPVAFRKAAVAFVLPPTLVIGVIYANVSAKFLHRRLLPAASRGHTRVGWAVWVGVVAALWAAAFVFAELIPSMADFLALLGAAFDSVFGFLLFAAAYYRMHRSALFVGLRRSLASLAHLVVLLCGLFLLGPGLYAAVMAIAADYAAATLPAFSCRNLSL
jgi:hypothetical protein